MVRRVAAHRVPGGEDLILKHLVLDVNGTVTDRGEPITQVISALERLREQLQLHLLTADTFGTPGALAASLGCEFHKIHSAQDKHRYLESLGAERCVAIGTDATIQAQRKVIARAIAGRLDRLDQRPHRLLIRTQPRREPALVTNTSRQPLRLQGAMQLLIHLGAHHDRLSERVGADRGDHELLETGADGPVFTRRPQFGGASKCSLSVGSTDQDAWSVALRSRHAP